MKKYNLFVEEHSNPEESKILVGYTEKEVIEFIQKLITLENVFGSDIPFQAGDLNFEEDFDYSVQMVCNELVSVGWTLVVREAV